jgi:hypothetical protein
VLPDMGHVGDDRSMRGQLYLTIHADWRRRISWSRRNVPTQIDDYSLSRDEWTILIAVRWAFHR